MPSSASPSPTATTATALRSLHRRWRSAVAVGLYLALSFVGACERRPPGDPTAETSALPTSSFSTEFASVDSAAPDVAASATTSSSSPSSSSPAGTTTRPDAPAPAYPADALATLRTRLGTLVGPKTIQGAAWSVLVVEEASGFVVFESGADVLLVPASNTKLFTCASALALLGEDHTTRTRIYASGEPDDAGAVDELYLVGEHDPSWSKLFVEHPDAALNRLAAAVRAKGIRKVRGAVWTRGEPLWEAARFHELDPGAHRVDVASHLAVALRGAGVQATNSKLGAGFDVPASAVLIGEERSPTLARICEPIGQLSHNEMADALSRHMGLVRKQDSSYTAGTGETLAWIKAQGIDPEGKTRLVDGSGLSRGNQTSARTVVALLRGMSRGTSATPFEKALAVAGEVGTLTRRMKGALLKGRFRGKTGTLEGVVATSGYLTHPTDGRRYVVSLLTNNVRDGQLGRGVHDRIVSEIAGIWSATTAR